MLNRELKKSMSQLKIFLGITITLFCLSGTVTANERKNSQYNSCQLISSSQAISQAKARSGGGKVVGVRLVKKGTQSFYRVRILVGKKRIKNLSIRACR